MRCLTSTRFNMSAIVLTQVGDGSSSSITVTSANGQEVISQDPESGAFIRVWQQEDSDPVAPGIQGTRIPVIARGILNGGIKSAGTTQMFAQSGVYDDIEYINLTFGKDVVITKRDRVTDIRDANNSVVWKEEESDNSPTVFNVLGVTPTLDPWGNTIEYTALLKRAEDQTYA